MGSQNPNAVRPERDERDYAPRTRLIHGQFHSEHWQYDNAIVPPMTASAAYRLESAERGAEGFREFANPDLARDGHRPILIYDRLDEPTRGMLEENLRAAHGAGSALCFATGMAAISAALGVLTRAGDRVVAHRTIYGCTYSLFRNWFPRLGIHADFIDVRDPRALRAALKRDVMVIYFETPCNPTLEQIDIALVRRAVDRVNRRRGKRRKVFIVVDNTFATPWGQRPLALGADIVVESLTKNVGGFGTDMGGAVLGPALLEPDLLLYRKDFGGSMSPKAAWPALIYGLPTLPLRLAREQETALALARFLEAHPLVERVAYPGLESFPDRALAERQLRDPDGRFAPGTLVYFVLKGEPELARRRGVALIDRIAARSLAITLAVSLGQVRTLIEHPSSMTHAAIPVGAQVDAGIDPGGLRLSVGLEEPRDLQADLAAGLDAAAHLAI